MNTKNLQKYAAYFSGTIAGAGYFPVAPGTLASALAIALLYFLQPGTIALAGLILLFFFSGIFSSNFIEKTDGKDPGHIVIDEVAGQWLTFLFVFHQDFFILISGFLLFRIFDIFKPFGINDLQNLKSGWGVMLDDILAGIYANIILQLLIYSGIFI